MAKEKKVKAESFQDLALIIMEMNINMESSLKKLQETILHSIEIHKKTEKDLKDYKECNDKRVTKIEKDVGLVKKILKIDD
jgi:hypothetical protein